ncbi:MAG: hypothetical protein AABO57_07310 [Acidobacteriota bacterium]
MHPLDGAYVRLDRAQEHLVELETVNNIYLNREARGMADSASFEVRQVQANQVWPTAHLKPIREPIPLILPVLIGETVQNLRTSLDYLVYELAILNTKTAQDGTQFPIEGTPEGFKRRRKTYLKFINPTHIAMIEKLQPCNGVTWTQWLAGLSNPDKHRHLVVSQSKMRFSARRLMTTDSPAEPKVGEVTVQLEGWETDNETGVTEQCMNMEASLTLFLAFEDGRHVIDTLKEITAQVANTLANFKPEF